jgi:hypothetical protein
LNVLKRIRTCSPVYLQWFIQLIRNTAPKFQITLTQNPENENNCIGDLQNYT